MVKTQIVTAVAVMLTWGSAAQAETITGSYTAVNPSNQVLINDDGQPFLTPPISESLTPNTPTTPTTFLQISPGNGSGTETGDVNITLTLSDGTAVTGVKASSGGLGATAANGKISFSAVYELNFANQTDCIVWNSLSCNPASTPATLGETLAVTFADGAVLDVNLYNASDWNIAPQLSFDALPASIPVPEPASLVLLGTALAGLGLIGIYRRPMPRRFTPVPVS